MTTALEKFSRLRKKHEEYDEKVYEFIYEALDYTLKNIVKTRDKNQHVSAKELTEGFRLYSIKQFGCLAQTVLNEWGIKTTRDIGNVVSHLAEFDLMSTQESDRLENFNNVYDFNEAFAIKPKLSYDYETKEWQESYV